MNHGRYCITSYLQLSRVGLVWPRPHRPALILLFAKKFFRALQPPRFVRAYQVTATERRSYSARMRWTGRIFWLLAFGPGNSRIHLSPAFTVFCGGSRIGCTTAVSQAARLLLQRLALGKSYPVTAAQL